MKNVKQPKRRRSEIDSRAVRGGRAALLIPHSGDRTRRLGGTGDTLPSRASPAAPAGPVPALRFGVNASRPTRERFSTVDYSNRTNFGLQTSRRSPRVRRATTGRATTHEPRCPGYDIRPTIPDDVAVR